MTKAKNTNLSESVNQIKRSVKSGHLRINDINFIIPPESILIETIEYDSSTFMLRKAAPSTIKTGKKRIVVNIPIIIDLDSPVMGYSQLARLIMQIRKCPIATVENEKLRSELLGARSSESLNLGMIIESISGSIDREFTNLVRCNISMSWFNHLPYTPYLVYKGDVKRGESASSTVPTSIYKDFIDYDCIMGDSGLLINDPTGNPKLRNNEISFYYKEYTDITNSLVSNESSDQSKMDSKRYQRAIVDTRSEGWVPAAEEMFGDDKKALSKFMDKTYYRWRKISISSEALGFIQKTGNILLEDLAFTLQTNVAYLPLLGYPVPVPQFMGGSISTLRGIFFAGATKDDSGTPIATSLELARLQQALDTVADNRVRFAKYAKDDYILVEHPIAKLLKYDKRIEKSSTSESHYYNEETGEVTKFYYSDLMPMVCSSRVSKTVEGLPFCSRLQLDMKETRLIQDESLVTMSTEDGKTSKYLFQESWIKILDTLMKRYEISCDGTKYSINTDFIAEDRGVADKLVDMLNNILSINKNLTSLSFIRNSEYYRKSSSALMGMIKRKRAFVSMAQAAEEARIKQKGFVNTEGVSLLVTEIIKLVNKNPESLKGLYDTEMERIIHFNSIPQSQVYGDMKIPLKESSPVYFFQKIEDPTQYREQVVKGSQRQSKEVEDLLFKSLFDDKIRSTVAGNVLVGDSKPSPAFNVSNFVDDKSSVLPSSHNPNEPEHRDSMLAESLYYMTPMNATLDHAFPGFKIYLRQDNFFEDKELSVSDLSNKDKRDIINGYKDVSEYFDISSIVDIRSVKDEENPADLLIIRVAVPQKDIIKRSGVGENDPIDKQNNIARKRMQERRSNNFSGPTDAELMFQQIGLKEGTRIQVRLGYASNPNQLDPEFSGRIVSISGKDILEIVCAGDGAELIREEKGVAGDSQTYSWNSNTPDVVKKIFELAPEVRSFGNTGYKTDFGIELNIVPWCFGGRSCLDNIFAPSLMKDSEGIFTLKTASTGVGVGVGLYSALAFAGIVSGGTLLPLIGVGLAAVTAYKSYKAIKNWIFGSEFTVYNQTIWGVLQELTLRHPGYICSVVPYDNRSTVFFGEPNEWYFYRGPTPFEAGLVSENTFLNNTVRETYDDEILEGSGTKIPLLGISDPTTSMSYADQAERQQKRRSILNNASRADDRSMIMMRMQKPFRTYHLITSEHDIISNDIEVTSQDVGNSVQVSYPVSSSDANVDGTKGFSDYKITDPIKADDDVRKEFIRNKNFTFFNAHKDSIDDLPERYARALLCRELGKVYRGKITITGRSNIKPHDVCLLRDTYNDISGPVGVSKVVQILSPQGGWVTEITPKMMVFPSNASGLYQMSMVHRAATFWLGSELVQFYTNRRPFLVADSTGFDGSNDVKQEVGILLKEKNINLDVTDKAKSVDDLNTANVPLLLQNSGRKEANGVTYGDTLVENAAMNVLENAEVGEDTREIVSITADLISVPFGAVGLLANFFVGSAFDGFINWSKYRQPILFYPITRYGQPWYAAMEGFQNNTRIERIKSLMGEAVDRLGFYKDTIGAYINYYGGD